MYCKNCGHESHCGYPLRKDVNNYYDRMDIRHNPPIICQSCRCEKCDGYWEVKNKHGKIHVTCMNGDEAYSRASELADENGEPFTVTKYTSKEYWEMKSEVSTTSGST